MRWLGCAEVSSDNLGDGIDIINLLHPSTAERFEVMPSWKLPCDEVSPIDVTIAANVDQMLVV